MRWIIPHAVKLAVTLRILEIDTALISFYDKERGKGMETRRWAALYRPPCLYKSVDFKRL